MDKECCDRCNALQVQIKALEKLIDERRERAEERFVSVEKAQSVADAAAREATGRLETVYLQRHEQALTQISINTNRLTAIEKEGAAKKDTLAAGSQSVMIAGVLFSMVVSMVTVVFNIFVYLKH